MQGRSLCSLRGGRFPLLLQPCKAAWLLLLQGKKPENLNPSLPPLISVADAYQQIMKRSLYQTSKYSALLGGKKLSQYI